MSLKQNDEFEESMKESADAALDEAQMVADDQGDQDLPEAPASVTIKVWIKGFGVMITARDTKVKSLLKKTETLIDYAESHGWKNVWDTTPVKETVSQPTVGLCPKCKAPLVVSTLKNGTVITKCSTNKWDMKTKTAIGCDYVKWPEKT
jgi:hypothetical protein